MSVCPFVPSNFWKESGMVWKGPFLTGLSLADKWWYEKGSVPAVVVPKVYLHPRVTPWVSTSVDITSFFYFRNLPYTVSQEEALTYSEVKSRLEKALTQLKTVVNMFLDEIISSTELLPFCITYMARVLHRALTSKFPHTPEKDILKVSLTVLLWYFFYLYSIYTFITKLKSL